jgi:hypothetical protein
MAAIMTLRLEHKRLRIDVIANICKIEGVEVAEEI